MIEEEEARARILGHVQALPARDLLLAQALNCFAARDLLAGLALPLFDNSSMDGYAVVAESSQLGARLKVVGEQPAGLDRKLAIKPGEALRIFTGAPMPAGADAVVMQEDVSVEDDVIVLNESVERGENVRRRGGDVAEGQKIISTGERLRAQTLALLAAQGFASVSVGGRVRAAVISTGDELASLDAKLEPGQIYDSNSVLLQALLQTCGVDVVSVTHCADRAEEIERAIRAGIAQDVMIITGGVSVGARDFVKESLTASGATLDLWRVAVKPGKPFLFGRAGDCAIFGLPGNPVSAFVTFLIFVRPALLRLMGASDDSLGLTRIPAKLNEAIDNPGERRHYIRGILKDGSFSPVGRQESHALFGLSRSNALLLVEPRRKIPADTNVIALTWE
jgi:molybdopterin molybdotransferase